jgi:predicted porin
LANGSLVAGNSAVLPGGQNPNGGFFGFGNNNSAISPISGTSVTAFAPVGSTPAAPANIHLDANTLALGLSYQASANWRLNALVEGAIGGSSGGSRQHRFELGTQYQLSERSRAYARYENQTGLASRYSLNPAEKSNAFVAGVESSYLPGASVFTEYRLRDAVSSDLANARDLQLASGLRNTWNLAEGVAASTNAEYLHVFDGKQQKGVALAGGLDYTANPLWKASAKLEWRRLFDNRSEPGNQTQDQWLNTLSVAKKLDRDWTVLARNYLLYTRNHDNSSGAPQGSSLQERAQLGFAWRPVDNNRVNGLARYEFKNVRDDAQSTGESYTAHIVSAHLDYHPSRPWWMTGRVAAKTNHERRLPQGQQTYNAWLLSGRVVYDITENWDIGVLASWLHSPQGGTSQYARGVEAGYLVKENLWLSVGYNMTGFSERDLSGADYTAKGVYLRLRFKFDENLFKGSDPAVNRSLAR